MPADLLAFAAALVVSAQTAAAALDEPVKPLNVLVITGGDWHDFDANTATLIDGLRATAGKSAFDFTILHLGSSSPPAKDGATVFDDADIFARYDTILAYHQGDLGFTDSTKTAMLDFIRSGGGFVGIHSAADSHPGWDEYDAMLGGRFEHHPPFGEITVRVDVSEHLITRGLDVEWRLNDEFYHLKNCRADDKLILMSGRSPEDDEDAPLRPVTWEKNYGVGRVFYTILGHGIETHRDARFHNLIANALTWSANAPRPEPDGRHLLFIGKETQLKNWSMAGPGGFRFEDGELVAHGGMGLLWFHERRFRDFTLELEYMTTRPEDNSGVFVRFPKPSSDPWYSVRHGHEIQICDTAGPKQRTGSIYSFADAEAGPAASRGPGRWNRYQITLRGDEYFVVLNGELILQWTSPTERHGREGYIGLQNHDDSSPVRFRNITVRELP